MLKKLWQYQNVTGIAYTWGIYSGDLPLLQINDMEIERREFEIDSKKLYTLEDYEFDEFDAEYYCFI